MELSFHTKPLRGICESEAKADEELGKPMADVLRRRLADLRAATSPRDLVAGNPRVVVVEGEEQITLDLVDGHRIAVVANHVDNPVTEENRVDWAKVTRIKILRIEHD